MVERLWGRVATVLERALREMETAEEYGEGGFEEEDCIVFYDGGSEVQRMSYDTEAEAVATYAEDMFEEEEDDEEAEEEEVLEGVGDLGWGPSPSGPSLFVDADTLHRRFAERQTREMPAQVRRAEEEEEEEGLVSLWDELTVRTPHRKKKRRKGRVHKGKNKSKASDAMLPLISPEMPQEQKRAKALKVGVLRLPEIVQSSGGTWRTGTSQRTHRTNNV